MKKNKNEKHTIEFKSSNSDFFDMLEVSTEPEDCDSDTEEIIRAVSSLKENNGAQALSILADVIGDDRDARWYYLNSLAYFQNQNLPQAILYIRQAVQEAPDERRYFLLQQKYMYEEDKVKRAEMAKQAIREDDESTKKGKLAILAAAIAFALFYVICLVTGIMG